MKFQCKHCGRSLQLTKEADLSAKSCPACGKCLGEGSPDQAEPGQGSKASDLILSDGQRIGDFKILNHLQNESGIDFYHSRQTTLQRDATFLAFSTEHPESTAWIKRCKYMANAGDENRFEVYNMAQEGGVAYLALEPLSQGTKDFDDIIDYFLNDKVQSLAPKPQKKISGLILFLGCFFILVIGVGWIMSANSSNKAKELANNVNSLLSSDDPQQRRSAMRVIAKDYSVNNLSIIGGMLEDSNWRVRLEAVNILKDWDRPETLRYLNKARLDKRSKTVRNAAQEAAKAIEAKYPSEK